MIMKQFFNHAFLGAIALTGAVCFSACSSNDDLTEDINPTYDPVANTVKANFSLALTSQLGARTANTRMDEYQTQATGTFRGMKNINLIPFDCIEEITKAKSRVSGSANVLSNVVIGSTENHLNASPGSYNYHYLDVTVPVGTGSFLFYGLSQDAIEPSNTTATAAQKFANGILSTGEANFATGSPEDFHFDLVPINSSTSPDAQCTAIINYLTAIAATNAGTSESPNYWSATEDVTLKDLYDKFVTLPAGSAESVRKTVSHLYQY